jgi:hypothetical protein
MTAPPRGRRVAWWALTVLVAGAVIMASRVSLAAFAGTGNPGPPPASVPLPGREVPLMSSRHIPFVGYPHAPYNSLPPTSGPHVPWVIMTGTYGQPVPDELGVHLLEHGHILIQYAPATPAAQVATLRAIALRFPADVLLAPYPKLRSGIALTAWGRIEILARPDPAAITRFITLLRGRYNHGWSRSWTAAHSPDPRSLADLPRLCQTQNCG